MEEIAEGVGMSGRSRVQTTLSRDSPSQERASVPDNAAAEVSAELLQKNASPEKTLRTDETHRKECVLAPHKI